MVLTVTTNFLESKNCTKKVLISHESYDKFNHLNTVNSFHKLIEERLQKYKGVASKIYKSLQRFAQRETQGMDNTEKLQYVLLRLKTSIRSLSLKGFEAFILSNFKRVIFIDVFHSK